MSSRALSRRQGQVCLLSLMLLLAQLTASGWQASGNMTDYLPTIRGFMDAAIEDGLGRDFISANISDECNGLWDQFWNVFVYWLRDPSSDMILYGYAFRSHWYWHNNYSPAQQSFVIWKDYHCKTQLPRAASLPETAFGNTFTQTAFQTVYDGDNSIVNDPWQWVHDVVENHLIGFFANDLNTGSSNLGISAVFINQIPSQYSSKFCHSESTVYRRDLSPAKYYFYGFVNRFDASS